MTKITLLLIGLCGVAQAANPYGGYYAWGFQESQRKYYPDARRYTPPITPSDSWMKYGWYYGTNPPPPAFKPPKMYYPNPCER